MVNIQKIAVAVMLMVGGTQAFANNNVANDQQIKRNCAEMKHIAASAMNSRLSGKSKADMKEAAKRMYSDAKSPVRGDKHFYFVANNVVNNAFIAKLPISTDPSTKQGFVERFSEHQEAECVDYLNRVAKKR